MEANNLGMPIFDTLKPVVMFSGQGSQKPGMGIDLVHYPLGKETYLCASDIFGYDVAKLMAEGPAELLNDTRHAQAALVTLSVALFRILADHGFRPSCALGFSLGQISALYATGMLSLEDTFLLTRHRAEAMALAAQENPGAMCALIGADEDSVRELCESCSSGDVVVIANYNCPGQIVIAGTVAAIERAESAWTKQKKRSARLATSGAFHSPLMNKAAEKLRPYLSEVEFSDAQIPLICNLDAQPLKADQAAKHLADHLVRPVRFHQSLESLVAVGMTTFIELGYGGVLTGLVKRVERNSKRINIEGRASLETFLSS